MQVDVTANPTAACVWQHFKEATPWGRQPRYLLRDRDAAHGGNFARRARRLGIQTLLSPVRAPRANAVAERVNRTLRNECLDHVIFLNEQHLRAVLTEFMAYYNTERPHRSLALDASRPAVRPFAAPVPAPPVLGGLHPVYERAG